MSAGTTHWSNCSAVRKPLAMAASRKLIPYEPTSGSDYRHMLEVFKSLKSLRGTGKTILSITHDVKLIHTCCTSLLCIGDDRVAW